MNERKKEERREKAATAEFECSTAVG